MGENTLLAGNTQKYWDLARENSMDVHMGKETNEKGCNSDLHLFMCNINNLEGKEHIRFQAGYYREDMICKEVATFLHVKEGAVKAWQPTLRMLNSFP